MTPTETIDQLVADGIVDALIQRVKTGKEAEVFIVRKGESYFAAKVYKERTARSFKNNVDYREGRQVRNTRDQRAMLKGSRHGLAMAESDWRHTEHDALVTVSHAGVRVPKPELFYEGVLLMELVLGADGQPAPRLIDVPLSPEEAVAYHRDVVGQIVGMLTCDLIHGDLSPYNILLAWNGPTVIDLPQVIKAAHNSQAEKFLARDVRNVTDHFARYAPQLKRRANDGYAIWRKYARRELTPEYFPDETESSGARPSRSEGERHHGPRPPTGRPPHQERPPRAPQDRPRPPHQGRPAGQHPHEHSGGHAHRPQEQRPQEHRPQEQRPQEQRPQEHRPREQRPADRHAPLRPHERPQAEHRVHEPHPSNHPGPARPQHAGQRPPRPEGGRAGGPPARRAPPPGPIIQRVTRLVPVSRNPSGQGAPPEGEGAAPHGQARFSMHHRRR
jgi:RIO kinase 1